MGSSEDDEFSILYHTGAMVSRKKTNIFVRKETSEAGLGGLRYSAAVIGARFFKKWKTTKIKKIPVINHEMG